MLLVILSILSRRLQNVNFLTFDVKFISDRVGTVLTLTYSVRFCFVLHAKTMLAVLYVKMCVVQQQQCFSGENVSEGSGQFNVESLSVHLIAPPRQFTLQVAVQTQTLIGLMNEF